MRPASRNVNKKLKPTPYSPRVKRRLGELLRETSRFTVLPAFVAIGANPLPLCARTGSTNKYFGVVDNTTEQNRSKSHSRPPGELPRPDSGILPYRIPIRCVRRYWSQPATAVCSHR